MLSQHGLTLAGIETDKIQTSSVLLSLLLPFIRIATWLQFRGNPLAARQNSSVPLYGRKLVVIGRKKSRAQSQSSRSHGSCSCVL